MEHDTLDDGWGPVSNALADVMIARKLPTKTMLKGMHAFLLALVSTGHGDAGEISEELYRMANYYRSLRNDVQA